MNKKIDEINEISNFLNRCNDLIQADSITADTMDKLYGYRDVLPRLKVEFLLEASISNIDEVTIINYLDIFKRVECQLYELIELNNLYI